MNEKLTSLRNFVVKHKTAIAVTATAVACLAVNQIVVKEHNEFLKKHDLFDEYYTPAE